MHHLGATEAGPDLVGGGCGLGRSWPTRRSRRHRSRSGTRRPRPCDRRRLERSIPSDSRPSNRLARPMKFSAATVRWKPITSAPIKPVDHLVAPRQPHEQLLRRKRDVQEEADAQVGAPARATWPAPVAGGSRAPRPWRRVPATRAVRSANSLVDRAVAGPAVGVVQRGTDRIVVQRPQRTVRDALVVPGDLRRRRARSARASCRRARTRWSGRRLAPVQPTHTPECSRSRPTSARTRPPGLSRQP